MASDPSVTFEEACVDWLRHNRPDRYDPADRMWIQDGVEELYELHPSKDPRRELTLKVLTRHEDRATTRTNKLIRDYADSPQYQLYWFDASSDPLAITRTVYDDDGKGRKVKERVALRALTSQDLRDFATAEEHQADTDYKARLRTCDGARLMADQMDAMHARRWDEWAVASSELTLV